jgi:hypothetical protein
MEGTGFNLLVHPSRYDIVTRTFGRGKGMEIQLSPQEIAVNQEASPQMEGTGIFGKKFDKFLVKNGLRKEAYALGDIAKPYVKGLIDSAIAGGATALAGTETIASGGLGASAVPAIALGAGTLSHLANSYLDKPGNSHYYEPQHRQTATNIGGPQNKIAQSSLAGQVSQNELFNNMNRELGTKYGNMAQASIDNFEAQKLRGAMAMNSLATLGDTYNAGIDNGYASRNPIAPVASFNYGGIGGFGLHRRHIRGGALNKNEVSVGKMGSFVGAQSHLPPALTSQPFSANFQFQHTLPPAYQRFSKGGGLHL